MKTYVVAGTYQQWKDFIRINHADHNAFPFVYGSAMLMGTENPEVIYIGTWQDRPDAESIVQMVKQRTR